MRVVIFEKVDSDGLPVELDSFKTFPIPRVGEQISHNKKIYIVQSIGHDYDNLQILVFVTRLI